MKSFDKVNARALGLEIAQALRLVGQKHGVTIEYGGGSVGDDMFTCRLRCKINDPAAVEAIQRHRFGEVCALFGLTPADYGREVTTPDGKRLKLLGFTNRPKYPLLVLDVETKTEMVYAKSALRHWAPRDTAEVVDNLVRMR